MAQQITPIFSGGVGRSGTTIVGRILRKHSDVLAGSPFEIKFITEVNGLVDLVFGQRHFLPTQISRRGYLLSKVGQFDPIKVRFHKFKRRISEDWWKRKNRLGNESGIHRAVSARDLDLLLDELESSLDSPIKAARTFLFGYVRKHRKWTGESFWMDTTPANMMYADFIYRLFPEAKFIEMRREPLDNIASVLKEPWGPNDPARAILWWKDRISLATSAKERVPQENHLTLQLEELVSTARNKSYETLISHIGIQDESQMRDFFEFEVSGHRANIGRWKTDFPNPDEFLNLFNRLNT
ncbi:MAG: sulfotransferase [Actinobacteria bacterium]|nr:sulfotransferase [Actinomycetota bacterium]